MVEIRAFDLQNTSIDDVAKDLGELYRGATIAKDPMFGWVQIVNDVTILIEDLRRGREEDGEKRAVKVMMRLLEFVGYYLHHHAPSEHEDLADLVAEVLKKGSYETLFAGGPAEGPTRWILAKYPHACSKCGQSPCHCLVWPWVIEERRENPEPYHTQFRDRADEARRLLKEKTSHKMSIGDMLTMFGRIYRNTYYSQEPWKVGMHLAEEVGEATTELSRLDLALRGKAAGFNLRGALTRIREQCKDKVAKEFKGSKTHGAADPTREARKTAMMDALEEEVKRFENGDPWGAFASLVSERFKEEVADVFSWIAALLVKLDKGRGVLMSERNRFVKQAGGGATEYLMCPWCAETACGNTCLVSHGVSSEIVEKISKL